MLRIFLGILLVASIGCSSSNKNRPNLDGTTLNLSAASTLEFYSAGGLGISAIRYIVRPGAGTVTMMIPDESGVLKEDKVVTLSDTQKSAVITPLASLSRQTWPACQSCTSGEQTLWVDVTGENRFYYAQEGNCSCTNSEIVPTLEYEQMNTLYQSILALFEE